MINSETLNIAEMKLCYVCPYNGFAWFTALPLGSQWGDDWNDAPYEHNAGEPYENRIQHGERVHHHLLKVAWDGPFSTPANLVGAAPACMWSVQNINRGCVAWLVPNGWDSKDAACHIQAGASIIGFIEAVEQGGGNVYLPRNISSQINAFVSESRLSSLASCDSSHLVTSNSPRIGS